MDGITLTFGDQAENHAGMEKIGALRDGGFTVDDLKYLDELYEDKSKYYSFGESAGVLVISNLFDPDGLYQEQLKLSPDKKAYMRGRVVNKRARYNLCFAEYSQEPDYENKRGRVVNFADVPLLNRVRENLPVAFGEVATNLMCEANYYYDVSKCGIGYHGDAERRIVIGLRLGNKSTPLHYQWFQDSKPIGDNIKIPLKVGDLYIMSEKAVGYDWKRRKVPTLRHATGCSKYTKI